MKIIEIRSCDKLYNQLHVKRHEYVWRYFNLNEPENFLEEEDKSVSLALVDGENIIGSLMLTPADDKVIRFRIVFIIPLYQNRGLGRKIICEGEEKAKEMGFEEILLIAPEKDFSFYTKLGYFIDGDWLYDRKINLKTIQLKKYIT